jgi:hypothetical protein
MAYRQYTDCVKPSNYIDLGFTYLVAVGLESGLIGGLFAAGLGGTAGEITIAVLIGVDVVLISFFYWWLNGRLICLEGGNCVVIGMVCRPPSIETFGKAGDNDASIFVLLAGGGPGSPYMPPQDENPQRPVSDYTHPPQGNMLTAQPAITAIGRGYSDQENGKYLKSLHCEFEGSGIKDALEWAILLLALLIALLVLLIIGGPIIAAFIWLLQLLLGLTFITALWSTLAQPFDPGNPDDADFVNYGTLGEGDIVVIQGRWIYDALHIGWNEIHAIHACQRLTTKLLTDSWPVLSGIYDLSDTGDVTKLMSKWCDILKQSTDAEEGGNRTDPANHWIVHPLLDGCDSGPIIV